MSDESRKPVEGPVVEEQVEFTLVELSRACGADEEQITTLIVEGVIEPIVPAGTAEAADSRRADPAVLHAMRAHWRFSGSALRRARLAMRLARDLEVNPPGVALAIDLMEEIDALRARLHRLGR